MFGRKEEKPKKRRTPRENLSQFGFMDMNVDNMGMDDDDGDDDDLEAELAALTSGSAPKPKKARPKPIPQADLDKLVKESIKDVDEEDDDSVDENDPDLLGELNDLTGDNEEGDEASEDSSEEGKLSNLLPLLEERLKMYQTAEANAKSAGEISRARRFARGSKTILDQLKSVKKGGTVKEEDIPPPVATRAGGSAPPPVQAPATDVSEPEPVVPMRPAPPPPPQEDQTLAPADVKTEESPSAPEDGTSSTQPEKHEESSGSPSFDPEVVAKLEERRTQYRQAAVAAKRAGNKPEALRFAQIVKQFDIVIEGVKGGQHADLSEMPPPPWEVQAAASSVPKPTCETAENQASSAPEPSPVAPEAPEAPTPEGPSIPKTIMEALVQRLELYQKQEAAAKADGNSRKERQMGRIVKQYQDAIKRHKAGKPFAADELPSPPGYPPIPIPGGSGSSAADPTPAPAPSVTPPTPAAPARSNTPPRQPEEQKSGGQAPPSPIPSGSAPKANVRKSPASRQEKQMALLVERQKDFKVAAMEAKSRGELNQAKEYLRLSKGFDKLIEATQSGLPVDLKTLPVPPKAKVELEADFDIISTEDCVAGTDDEIYEKLVQDLQKQVQTCMSTRDHFKAMGDIASANRFENMAVHSKKDMDAVKHAFRRKDPIPKFHYETRKFSIVQCCTDLMDNDLELTIVQGINYNVPNPKDVDTYVRFELPWPSAEEPQKDRTNLVKDTNNPVYDGKFNLQIQRNVRACQRIFKRHGIKCEVWSRGAFLISLCCGAPNSEPSGFFRSDTLIGTATIKLQPLESKCIIHDSFDLMDGRKAVGGKLEVKIRLRNPIVSNQVEDVTEKWLIIDRI
ncbi:coiled-coil and C2 domain-containing protein 1-like isoform X2 [Thrips palmi]|uniref:Coiled-coil and C2 domain-containing protein 1-like isoform X2 n=1 Tax=Thrips palmi TaxID=161013 RepID=A0A6P8YTH1_THRPL|nr:coiled-coil and C2 domain-containing protein 1-like isoform X2 [Thrips palmi]